MANSSSLSFFSEFGLLFYLEELTTEELYHFKFLLRETMEPGCCPIPWTAVKKAKREELACLMNKYYPGEQAWNVTLKIFGMMNLTDLCKRAEAEINRGMSTMRPEEAEAMEDQVDQEAMLGDGTEYRIQIKKTFCMVWDKDSLLGESGAAVTQNDHRLLEHLFDVDVNTGERPRMVVLLGAAGVGKTALMRKAMLDWAQGKLYQHKFAYVFYLSGKAVCQMKESSFAQLISNDWPTTEIPIERVLAQPSSLLFIIDSFDELDFAFEEPWFALCKDWTQVHPVSFLMSSLLRKVLLPECTLLVTTRLTGSKRLKLLLKKQHYVKLLGMSENARMDYIYQFFKDKTQAMEAISSIRNNEILFNMCHVPLTCRLICSCLEQQMENGGNVTETCQTTTALFVSYICNLFAQEDEYSLPNEALLRSLCHMAAQGVWNMTHVIYRSTLRRHELTRNDISVFLDMNILQKDRENENCYMFAHLQVQEFFAAMFYLLNDDWERRGRFLQPFVNLKLLLESKRYQDPHLTQMKCFLFGLLNKDRLKILEESLNCTLSLEIKYELLQWMEHLGNSDCSPTQLGLLDLFHFLYETQDEGFVIQAMSYFPNIVINLCEETHLLVSSFCLKYCQRLQTFKLIITIVFQKMFRSSLTDETWQRNDNLHTHCWQELCSVLHTNKYLRELDLGNSNLDELVLKIFNQELRLPNCKLQKLLLRSVSFLDGCQDFFSFLPHNKNLIHLDLKDTDMSVGDITSLCEALESPGCKLQNLRLESCTLTTVCCVNISKSLVKNQSLIYLNLSTNNLLDDGVKLLCGALEHPKCNLERLSIQNCGLTEASCKDLSLALINNSRLTHLCLTYNNLGDSGVKLLSDALKHPQCTLQSLVLRSCHLTPLSTEYISSSLLHNKSLTHLDLAFNWLHDDGARLLCNVLQRPVCSLQELELMGGILTHACCEDLASAIVKSPNLCSLDLGNNNLGNDGVKILCEALRYPDCNIQTLGLQCCGMTSSSCQDLSSSLLGNQTLRKMNLANNTFEHEGIKNLCEILRSPECKLQVLGLCKGKADKESRKLLEAVEVSNPNLVIKSDSDYLEEYKPWWQCF